MKKTSIISFILILNCLTVLSQTYSLNGNVTDAGSGESLVNANVFVEDLNKGTITNNYGFYSLSLPKGKHKVQISYIGYTTKETVIDLDKDNMLNFGLESDNQLKEVVVKGDAYRNLVNTQLSLTQLKAKEINNLPSFLGETDLLKTIQLMPGFASGTEGSGGVFVRGGDVSQNLILLDGVPVYNVNHLFGFFSVFNNDAIKDVSIYSGSFPARYGGRLSSVIDI